MVGGKKEICGICRASFTKTHSGVQCKSCHLRFHSACEEITDDELKAIKDSKHLCFVCSSCGKNPPLPPVDERSLRDEITILNGKFDEFMRRGNEDQDSIKKAFADVVGDLKREVSSCMKEMKSDIIDCNKLIRQVDSSTSVKISQLEVENNALHRKLTRSDLVISGLPVGLSNLTAPIIELGSFYKVPVSRYDINHVCYINKKKSVLVKFNSVFVRDEIMKMYFKAIKTQPLLISDLVKLAENDGVNSIQVEASNEHGSQNGIDAVRISKRVFLNDHHSPAAGKLNAVCRQLLKTKVIAKFRVLDADKPKVKLTMSDGKEVVADNTYCAALLKENGST